jgi:hypothetical protein
MPGEAHDKANTTQEPGQGSCPLGVPAVMCMNYEITGWGCDQCTSPPPGKDSTRDARR